MHETATRVTAGTTSAGVRVANVHLSSSHPRRSSSDAANKREHRKSLRTRPSELLGHDHGEPLSPLTAAALPRPLPAGRSSAGMSLFHLFSKPKVERARGYAEAGLAAAPTPPPPTFREANASTDHLTLQVGPHATRDVPVRAPSAMSSWTTGTAATTTTTTKSSKKKASGAHMASSRDRKARPCEPPPLFQAYPQARKHGVLEVSSVAAETVLHKSKSRKPTGEQARRPSVDDNGGGIETKRTAKTAMRHVANGHQTHVDLPKKIIILSTTGCLLQYAETGPSDRLPERILRLGTDSAAFACDLIPGKHYVLQISQTVDQQGVVIAHSSSLLSKLGFRSGAAKRETSNILLVMPNAADMGAWMVSIREEITSLGGTAVRPSSALRQKSEEGESFNDLKKTPSRSKRYQVTRQASKATPGDPRSDAVDVLPAPPPPKFDDDDDNRSDTNTIDGIEQEAGHLAEESVSSPLQTAGEAGGQSARSSITLSVDQQRLNSLRSSKRMSHSTYATTVATSRTNSLSGSPPPPEGVFMPSADTTRDHSTAVTSPPYRILSSYGFGRRRSAMPLPTQKEQPLPPLELPPQGEPPPSLPPPADSPVTGRNSPMTFLPASTASPRTLTVASSEPNLRAMAIGKARQDSKLQNTPPPSERPTSIVGDLPALPAWASSPSKRMSIIQAAAAQANSQRSSMMRPLPQRAAMDLSKPGRRHSAQPFNLPLKINPSTPANRPPERKNDRDDFNAVDESAGEPRVHTLNAKVDPSRRTSFTPTLSSISADADAMPVRSGRSPSIRLSSLPSHMPGASPPPPSTTPPISDPRKRSPSASAMPTNVPPAQNTARTLRRPNSMQVRSDHAPFLTGVKSTGSNNRMSGTVVPSPSATCSRTVTAPPIRNLKPSRSVSALPTVAIRPKRSFSAATTHIDVSDEAADQHTPLLPAISTNRPASRQGIGRKVPRSRASLPELDLGIPVVGLGPPAPPPSVPLPLPPPLSSEGGATGSQPQGSLPSVTVVGPRTGPRAEEATAGLGIKVGGS